MRRNVARRLSGGGVDGTSIPKIRNAAVANATKQARGDADVAKKREELQRRIEETRRKLQSVSATVSLPLPRRCVALRSVPFRSVKHAFRVPGWLQVVLENQPKHIRFEQPRTGEAPSFEQAEHR